jgi:hypothetical protein
MYTHNAQWWAAMPSLPINGRRRIMPKVPRWRLPKTPFRPIDAVAFRRRSSVPGTLRRARYTSLPMILRIVIRHLFFAAAAGLALWAYAMFGFRGLVIEAPYCVLCLAFGWALGLQGPSGLRCSAVIVALIAVDIGWASFRNTQPYQSISSFQLSVIPQRCTIKLSGVIPPDLPRQMRQKLEKYPRTRALILDSEGGSTYGIIETAELLRNRQVTTGVSAGHCNSACAFLWVTMKQRILMDGQRSLPPGFHAPYTYSPWGIVPHPAQRDAQVSYLRKIVKAREVFIDRAETFARGVDRIRRQDLQRLGIATVLMRGDDAEWHNFCDANPPRVLQ